MLDTYVKLKEIYELLIDERQEANIP